MALLNLLLLILFSLFISSFSHVAFIYPAARYPPLDFLDASRTIQPCGMPRGKNPYFTTFAVGKNYNLTWTSNHHLHKGGIRITLLDPNEKIIQQLEPQQSWLTAEKETPLNVSLSFPQTCHGCVLRIERQALEYGDTYIFHSCADVNIEASLLNSDESQCSGNGRFSENGCICRKYFTGEACQYRVECENDADCFNGRCVEESRPALIQKTCFCDYGFYGKNCETQFKNENSEDMCFNFENLVDTAAPLFKSYGIFNSDCYEKTVLNKEDFVFSRVIENEVEIILDYNTTGWVSIGWRPLKLDPSCRTFPEIGLPRSRSFRQVDPKQTNGFLKSALHAPLHGMDCTDIIVASVVEGRSRVQDMYSRDRSTPLLDTFFEGEFSLTAAFGVERDGRTIVMFRRNIREIEPSDHPMGPGKIHGIWAKSADISDELRYHGYKSRGTKEFEFVRHDAMPASGPLLFIQKNNANNNNNNPTTPPSTTLQAFTDEFIHSENAPPQNTLDFSADFQVIEPESSPEPSPEPTPFEGISVTEATTISQQGSPELQSSSPRLIKVSSPIILLSFIIRFIIML